jgi:signal transduction histidine kinase
MVRIVVADNGPGIPPEAIDRIFNVFVSTKGERGTGLGLAVSRKILREHGGDIQATSREGEGSSFVMEFPARRTVASAEVTESADPTEDGEA